MVFVFNEMRLPGRKSLKIALSYIYGIGYTRSFYICDLLGFGLSYKTYMMNNYYWECILIIMRMNYLTGKFLKDFIRQRLVILHGISLIRIRRMFLGLPVRGQRTHSNSKTPLMLKPAPIVVMSAKDIRKKNAKLLVKKNSKKNVKKK